MRAERDFTIVQLLDLVTRELCTLLRAELQESGGEKWWEQRVLSILSPHQREQVVVKGFTSLEDFDLATLLHIFDNNWRDLQQRRTLDKTFRTYLKEMREIRNCCIGHASVRGLPVDDEIRYLDTIGRFAEGLKMEESLVTEIRHAHERKLVDKAKELTAYSEQAVDTTKQSAVLNPEEESREESDSTSTVDSDMTSSTPSFVRPEDGFHPSVHAEVRWCKQDDLMIPTIGVVLRGDDSELEYTAVLPFAYLQTGEAIRDIFESLVGRTLSVRFLNVEISGQNIVIPEPGKVALERVPLIVLEPHWLINVTALTHFDYCPRNYFISRYQLQPKNAAMLRGTFVHEVFDHILENPDDTDSLLNETASVLGTHGLDMHMIGTDPDSMYEEAKYHLNGLLKGTRAQKDDALADITAIYPERYIINPDLGLKGKIDVIAEKENGSKQAIELKTGKPWGGNARAGDEFQVRAYHLMMLFKGESKLDDPMVVYSGEIAKKLKDDDPVGEDWTKFMFLQVYFDVESAMHIMDLRNQLVAADYLHRMSFESNERKCKGCAKTGKDRNCSRLHDLGVHGGVTKSSAVQSLDIIAGESVFPVSERLVSWFNSHNNAIAAEHAAVKEELGTFISLPPDQRAESGKSLQVMAAGNVDAQGLLKLSCSGANTSEFREGDPCLLSDSAGPVRGECLEVYIANVDQASITVRVPSGVRRLWFTPHYLDANATETHFENNFGALYDFLDDRSPNSEVLTPLRHILLEGVAELPANDLDVELPELPPAEPQLLPAQEKAVRAACGLKQVLLVQGPPGSGKTYTVARMIQALHAQGKRILVATYTHRASDELMKKLRDHAPDVGFIKLGRSEAVAHDLSRYTLEELLENNEGNREPGSEGGAILDTATEKFEQIESSLKQHNVFIATTHAWTSAAYDGLANASSGDSHFDVAIVDEASQVILPQMLGTLRLAKKWILVGDHRQLPPVLKSEEAAPLSRTLFEMLHDDVARQESTHILLSVQHRMPRILSNFISNMFYDGELETTKDDLRLEVNSTGKFAAALSDEHKIVLIHAPADASEMMRTSKREMRVVRRIVRELRESGFPLMKQDGTARIGIIAPYRAQVALIRRMLEGELHDTDLAQKMVDTVDRFQGDERDMILLSTCFRPEDTSVPLLYRDERRLNVALSRARAKLIVIGDFRLAHAIPGFESLITYTKQQSEHCTTMKVSF